MNCPNCRYPLSEDFRFCPGCGQEVSIDVTLKSLLSHFLSDYFTFDSKIIRSLTPLILKPAFLTKEFIKGRRVQYIPPLRLFIFLSIIFFLLLNWLKVDNAEVVSETTTLDQSWNNYFESWLPKLFFFLSPLFALILSLLYKRKKAGLMQHFLFSLHFHSTLFLVGIFYVSISYFFSLFHWFQLNAILLTIVGVYLVVYLWRALSIMYQEKVGITSLKFFLLVISYVLVLGVSSMLLFLLSINS